MAHPKRRHSKSRKNKRRTHQKISVPQLNKCPQCGGVKLTHRICLSCGYYNGKKILEIDKKEKKKKVK
jgi:large subunit ribosomal protein L32